MKSEQFATTLKMRRNTNRINTFIVDESIMDKTKECKVRIVMILAILDDHPLIRQGVKSVLVPILKDVEGIEFVNLTSKDVVRHELVQKIIKAYEKHEDSKNINFGGKG